VLFTDTFSILDSPNFQLGIKKLNARTELKNTARAIDSDFIETMGDEAIQNATVAIGELSRLNEEIADTVLSPQFFTLLTISLMNQFVAGTGNQEIQQIAEE